MRYPLFVAVAALSFACADVAPEPERAPPVVNGGIDGAPACAGGDCVLKSSGMFAGEPGAGVEFIVYGTQRNRSNARWGSVLNDIASHIPNQYGSTYDDADLVTFGHETSHGIHSDIRNYHNNTGTRANGFYVLEDRAALVKEPNMRKSAAGPFIPQSLRGSRFGTYVTGQQAWDDTPLYIWDEWNSYVNGSATAVARFEEGLWDAGQRDAVEGTLEFVVYAVAVAMAVEQHDPQYFASNVQFREFLAWNVRRSMELFRAGAQVPQFARASQDAYLDRMENSADAEAWRAFSRRFFGAEWANAVLFGDGALLPPNPEQPELPDPVVPPGDDGVEDEPGNPVPPIEDPVPPGEDPELDADTDGVINLDDLCSHTAANAAVWRSGEWAGCAAGQIRDADRIETDGPDRDLDGIGDDEDLCRATPRGVSVWRSGDWIGCGAGEHKDPPRADGADADRDGVADAQDQCSATPNAAAVWRSGEWLGCAEGQVRD